MKNTLKHKMHRQEQNFTKHFSRCSVKDITNIVNLALVEKKLAYIKIQEISKDSRTFENTFFALENSSIGNGEKISAIHLLVNVSPKKEIREGGLKAIDEYQKKIIDIEYDPKIYSALKDYYVGNYKKEKVYLKDFEIKYVEDTMLSYKQLGFNLSEKKQKEFKSLTKKLAKISSRFSFNINRSEGKIECTKEELKGLPDNFIESLLKSKKTGKYIVTTAYPHLVPFMKLAKNPQKRKELAITSLQMGGMINIKLLSQMLELRHKQAITLGFKNHIERMLILRMAKTEKTAKHFINELYKRVYKKSRLERDILSSIKTKELGKKSTLEFFDVAYYTNILYQNQSQLDTEAIKDFFETDHTQMEMFKLYEKLFGLSFVFVTSVSTWHPSVKVIEVIDKKTKLKLGFIYLDLYPREGKYGHAAVIHVAEGFTRKYKSGEYSMPVCALVCNFKKPSKKNPSLLSLREVETLFHEFGHALHLVLTTAEIRSQAGTSVARDFVETPSQMLENFVYEKSCLKKISRNYLTGKSLDASTINKIIANKNFMMATNVSKQLMYCMFDFAIHGSKTPKDLVREYNNIYKKIMGRTLPDNTYFPAGFGHMDGYDAGYYSYMWSLVYAQDIYSKFKNAKSQTQLNKIGLEYRKKILEVGSSREEMISVVDFLGRKPNTKAFFESQGI